MQKHGFWKVALRLALGMAASVTLLNGTALAWPPEPVSAVK